MSFGSDKIFTLLALPSFIEQVSFHLESSIILTFTYASSRPIELKGNCIVYENAWIAFHWQSIRISVDNLIFSSERDECRA